MKRTFQIIISVPAVSILGFSVLAQDTSNPNTNATQSPYQHMIQGRDRGQLKDTVKTSDVIGMSVVNDQGQKLGKVEDLAVDVESGRIVQVIIATGGLLGMGETLTPVPPGVLYHEGDPKVLDLDASADKFNAAPKCAAGKWDEDTQSNRVVEIYGYYDQKPYFVASQYDRNVNGNVAHNYHPANRARSNLGYVQNASKLMGTPVTNLQAEKIGKVENLIVDLPAGRIEAVIVASGGYLGIDDELSAVPPTAFRFDDQHEILQLDATKETLARSPHFKSGQWPDFSQSSYAGGVYHAYHIEPYFNDDATNEPDNTARNLRDRDSHTLTPLDQGNSQADIDTTAQIRKEIMAVDGISVNAKNVKIITMNGHVTLRGPVNSEDEKRQIGEIADRIAQSGNVDNQLEVAQTTTSLN
jgi:hyperosmotically inducible protein